MHYPVNPPSTAVVVASGSLALLAGTSLFARSWKARARANPGQPTGRLAPWTISPFEFAFLLATILLVVVLAEGIVATLWGPAIRHSPDKDGLVMALYGFAFHGCGLLGWPLYQFVRHRLYANYATEPPVDAPPKSRQSWSLALGGAVTTLLIVYPLLLFISPGWIELLRTLELPTDTQDAVTTFTATKSPLLLSGMITVACVLAPFNEEMIFRRGLYHFLRAKNVQPAVAVMVSALLFAALHGNWAGFLPLAVLGVMLALAYEWTGDIRVPILTHALFNLTTVVLLFLGVSQ